MSQIITVQAFSEFNLMSVTELTADIAAEVTSLPVKNDNEFDTDHVVLIGSPGAERSEIATPSAVANNAITVPATDQPHKAGTKVYKLRAEQARIYAAPNVDGIRPTTDTYSLLGAVTFSGDVKEPEYKHAAGGSSFWYLYTYLNTIPTVDEETDKVLTDAIRGGNEGRYATVDEVRIEAGLVGNKWIKSSFIYEQLISAEDEVNTSLLLGGYTLPLSPVNQQVKKANILLAAGYVLTTDYGPEHSGTNKDGEHKIKMARDILGKIESGEAPLADESGTAINRTNKVRGYPDDTAKDEVPSEARIFHISDKF